MASKSRSHLSGYSPLYPFGLCLLWSNEVVLLKITFCLLLTNSSDFFSVFFLPGLTQHWSSLAWPWSSLLSLFLQCSTILILFLLLWPHLCHSLNVLSFSYGKSLILNYPPRSPHTFPNPLVRDLVSTFVFKYSLQFTPILFSLPRIFCSYLILSLSCCLEDASTHI